MPFISLSADGSPVSTTELPSGTYYAASLGLSNELAERSIEVGITKVEMMDANVDSILWTNSLLSCFPAFLIYKNGTIGLLHGFTASIEPIIPMLKKPDLEEIRIIYKPRNLGRAAKFSQNLIKYFQDKKHVPQINIEVDETPKEYTVALCYRSKADNKPVVLIAKNTRDDLVTSPSEFDHQHDEITAYKLEDARRRFGLNSKEMDELFLQYQLKMAANAPEDSRFFQTTKPQNQDVSAHSKSKNCTLL